MTDEGPRPIADPVADPVGAIALLDEPRRRALYELVTSRPEPVGRDEAARALGIGRELAAFHLDRLAGAGLLEVEFRRLSGRTGPGAGRPAKLYRRSGREAAVSLPARNYGRLAEMLAEAIEEDPDHGAEGAADELARAKGRSEGRQARAKSRARQLRAGLIELLGEVGYQPTTTPEGTIRLQNCPYHDLAANHRDLTCGMNLAWARGVLEGLAGAPAAGPSAADPGAGDRAGQLEANLAPEPGYCCVVFSEPNPTESDRSDS